MSIALKSDWFEPKSASNEEDSNASLRGLSFQLGWFAEPIFLTGDYPQIMKDWITIFDPHSIAWKGYGSGIHAPGE